MDVPSDRIPYLKKAFDGLETGLAGFLQASAPDWIIYDFAPHWLPSIATKLGISRAFFLIINAWFATFLVSVALIDGPLHFVRFYFDMLDLASNKALSWGFTLICLICWILQETEERMRKKHEEVNMLENSHFDYDKMKMRMQTEIAGLLEIMEATKQQGITLFLPARIDKGNAERPEVRIVTWNNDERATDALPVHGFEHYKAKDYALAHAPFSGSSYAGGQSAAGDEPLYYIVSPQDVVIAKPRWVFHFAHLRQLPVLVPYIPTENPRLRDTAYEVLAELYVIDGWYEKAFALYADLMKPDIFDFLEKHNLHDALREKLLPRKEKFKENTETSLLILSFVIYECVGCPTDDDRLQTS
ncbi:hypothetical protein LOK49_LG11G00135 [Camellia lanceoleosa]|uniref:Uncharacterized protein n=1 Tax=Camellia lanceoleosa TaxID=1840588 RepID=A0ACC0G648_9ERIC|nr:hypothetical protein LOK49_LG11G00135 [Camellia lanceoleosa]